MKSLTRYSRILEIVGDIVKVHVPVNDDYSAANVAFGDLGLVEERSGFRSLARVIRLDGDVASLQVFHGTKGLSTSASVQFLGHPLRVT